MKVWEEFLKLDGWHSSYSSVDKALRHYARRIKSEKTRENFCLAVMLFCKHCGLDPDAVVSLSPEEASKRSQAFTDSLRDNGYSIRYVNVNQAYLSTFFRENGFTAVKTLDVERYHQPARYRKKPEYIPDAEEIYRMGFAAGSAKNKAMIFSLYSSGLRNSTLRAVLVGDVKKELESGLDAVKIPVYPEMKKIDPGGCKGDIPYYAFIEKETIKALKEYLDERKQVHGNIADADPLFCSDSHQVTHAKQSHTPVSKNGLERMIKRAAKQAGIEHWKDVTPKALRKAYETALRNNKLDVKDQEFLMGHILPGTQDPYYDYTKTEHLREKYRKIEFFPRKNSSMEELRKRQVLDMVKVLGFSDDKIKRVEEALAKYEKVDEAMEEIKKLSLNSHGKSKVNCSRNGNGHNRRDSYRIIKGERKLISSLNSGWDLVKELPEDKFILKKDL